MAKYGNFVGKEGLNLTKEEARMFKAQVFCELKKVKLPFELTFKDIVITDKDPKYKYAGGVVELFFGFPKQLEFRNIRGSRIVTYGVSFYLFKSKGYLKEDNGVENEDVTEQYTVRVSCHGKEIKYKCRNKEDISLKGSFIYGTEFSDFDLYTALNDLCMKLTIR